MDDPISQLITIFSCPICFELVKKPICTSCCDQLICIECVRKEPNNFCPFCRSPALLRDQHPFQFAENITSILSIISANRKFSCKHHKKPFEFFCETCSSFLCSDCIFSVVVDGQHQGHHILKQDEALKHAQRLLKEELSTFVDTDLPCIQQHAHTIHNAARSLAMDKFAIETEGQRDFEVAIQRLESRFDNYSGSQKKNVQSIKRLLEKMKKLKSDYEVMLTHEPPELFANQQEISKRLLQVKKEVAGVITDNPTFESYKVIPQPRSAQVKVKLREEAVYSDLVELFECKWRLKVSSKDHYVSIFVELFKGTQEELTYGYSVELLANNRSKQSVLKKYSSVFSPGQSYGWNRFLKVDKALHDHIDSSEELTIVLSITPTNFYSVYRNYEHHSERLKRKISLRKSAS